jgi:ABC-type branched-subunit amino acid transport system substrate-binding protein
VDVKTLRNNKHTPLLLAIIIVSGVLVFLSLPTSQKKFEEDKVPDALHVKIGVMSPTSEDFEKYRNLASLALTNINNYCNQTKLPYSFEFIYSNAEGMASTALENLQKYHSSGVDLVVGCGWSSQLCASMSYINENNMLVISPTSTNPQECTRKVDNVFKMSPIDTRYSQPVAAILNDHGITRLVALYRGDAWADGILYLLSREYDGELIEIRYPSETTDDGFIEFLEKTELAIQNTVTQVGAEYVSVLLLSFSEDLDILKRVENYPVLMDVTWYRAEGDLPSQQVLEKAGIKACKLKLIGPYPVLPVSEVYRQVNRSYFDSFGESLGFFDATIYDSCWVLALSVIKAKSLKTSTIVDVLPSVASNYSGITGFCNFDLEGDRNKLDMELWGYFQIDGIASRYRYGSFFASNKTIKWRIE